MLKLGYPWLSLKLAQLYPYLSRFIPTYTREGYPGISHYKNLILGYPKTTFLSRLILGYPGISHSSGYPGISRYKSGYGRVSFFQMDLPLSGPACQISTRHCITDSFNATGRPGEGPEVPVNLWLRVWQFCLFHPRT